MHPAIFYPIHGYVGAGATYLYLWVISCLLWYHRDQPCPSPVLHNLTLSSSHCVGVFSLLQPGSAAWQAFSKQREALVYFKNWSNLFGVNCLHDVKYQELGGECILQIYLCIMTRKTPSMLLEIPCTSFGWYKSVCLLLLLEETMKEGVGQGGKNPLHSATCRPYVTHQVSTKINKMWKRNKTGTSLLAVEGRNWP